MQANHPSTGSLLQEPPLLQDLQIRILSSSILQPSKPTEKRILFLSNIDQVLNFSVETVHFFAARAGHSAETVAETLRSALDRVLVPYDFLAGRLSVNQEGRLEIDCNSAGVGFVVAASGLELADLGELEYPNPAFRQLATAGIPAEGVKMEDQPLCSFQVTSFQCGGFALGVSNNHVTFDGHSFKSFLDNLAALTRDGPPVISRPPFTDRRLLSVRSPPRVCFPHPELIDIEMAASVASPTMLELSSCALDFKLFKLSATDVASLKLQAATSRRPTSFNVVVAHIWRCKVLSSATAAADGGTSKVLYAVDIRGRLRPPLPMEYAGNAVMSAYGEARVEELETWPLGRVVDVVVEGTERMVDEYIRSVIDWGEMHRGYPRGDVFVSSWWKLGFADVEFGWGRPVYCCPVVHPMRDIVLLFPSMGGADKGVNVLVALPREDMEKFARRFVNFLEA